MRLREAKKKAKAQTRQWDWSQASPVFSIPGYGAVLAHAWNSFVGTRREAKEGGLAGWGGGHVVMTGCPVGQGYGIHMCSRQGTTQSQYGLRVRKKRLKRLMEKGSGEEKPGSFLGADRVFLSCTHPPLHGKQLHGLGRWCQPELSLRHLQLCQLTASEMLHKQAYVTIFSNAYRC